jgi:phosphoglycolate phosphatase
MRPASVLFDLDGTLIDHFKAIQRCHAYAMRQLGLPEPTLAQVRAAVGGGVELAITRLAGADKVATLLPHFLHHWQDTNLDDVTLLPGAREILQALAEAGVPRGVLTNKRGNAAREVCGHLGLMPLLQGVWGAGDTAWLKPDPAFTRHALEQIGTPAAGSILVGDSPFDVATARQAGLGFIGVTTGTHTAAELRAEGADRIFADLNAVTRELQGTAR